jgi:hypothetical protein
MFEMYETRGEICGLLGSVNKLDIRDDTGVIKSCKDLCVALEGDLHRMDFFQKVKILRRIIPENCTSLNALKYITSRNL